MKIPTNRVTAAGLIIALGIIYGDIGTSPLYALRATVLATQREALALLILTFLLVTIIDFTGGVLRKRFVED